MKLLRWGAAGQERPGMVDRLGHVRDLSSHCADIVPDMLSPDRLARLAAVDPDSLPLAPADCAYLGAYLIWQGHSWSEGAAGPAAAVQGARPQLRILHTEAATSFGGQEYCIYKEMLAMRARGRTRSGLPAALGAGAAAAGGRFSGAHDADGWRGSWLACHRLDPPAPAPHALRCGPHAQPARYRAGGHCRPSGRHAVDRAHAPPGQADPFPLCLHLAGARRDRRQRIRAPPIAR